MVVSKAGPKVVPTVAKLDSYSVDRTVFQWVDNWVGPWGDPTVARTAGQMVYWMVVRTVETWVGLRAVSLAALRGLRMVETMASLSAALLVTTMVALWGQQRVGS